MTEITNQEKIEKQTKRLSWDFTAVRSYHQQLSQRSSCSQQDNRNHLSEQHTHQLRARTG